MTRWFNSPLQLRQRWAKNQQQRKRCIDGRYILLEEIGHGASAIVHLALDKNTNMRYAIKEISKSKLERQYHTEMMRQSGPIGRRSRPSSTLSTSSSESSLDDNLTILGVAQSKRRKLNDSNDSSCSDIINEFNILKRLTPHENVIKFIELIRDDPDNAESVFIVMEYAEKGTVMDIVPHSVTKSFPDTQCRQVFKQLTAAVDHIHQSGFIHRDIKPQNLIISSDNEVKLIDFGNATFISDTISYTSAGTPAFMAPELLKKVPRDQVQSSPTSVDLWSMGVTLYCLTYGHLPFEKSSLLDLYGDIQSKTVSHSSSDKIDPDLIDLIDQLLQKNPNDRITMERLKLHPWMKK